jgi:membrane protease subunit HflK
MAKDNIPNMNIPTDLGGFKKHIGSIAIGIIILIMIFSSVFTVGTEEAGVILRFGKYKRTVSSGLNFKLPFGIEEVYKIPVERQLKEEFGFRTVQAGVRTRYSTEKYEDESLMLTGDLNLAEVEWVVQYRIRDPYKYLFKVRNPQNTLRDISESVMRQVVGNRTVNEVLTVGRQDIASKVEENMQKLCNEYETGIKIEQIVLQDVNPPDPVKPSFNAVNEAQQEKERLINDALAGYNKVVPKAKGQAKETIQQAQGYAIDRVNRAEGEATRFNDLYIEYIKAPEVTKKRIFLETMEKILPKIGNKIITDQNGANILPLFEMTSGSVKKLNMGGDK